MKTTSVKHENGVHRLYRGEQELYAHITDSVLKTRFPNGITEEQIHQGLVDKHNNALPGAVPDAPFKDNYHEFVLKRLLRMAAEQGYDSIGWTTADIQSERWSDEFAEGYRIEYDQDMPKFLKKYGKQWGATVSKSTLNNKSNMDTYTDNNGKGYSSIREWYDSVMDNCADTNVDMWNDYLAGKTKITQKGNTMYIESTRTGEILDEELHITTEPDIVWSMDITDSMKNSVLYEGQVMYSDRDNVSVYDLMGENDKLIKENEQLKEDVDRLKERLKIERQVTNGNFFNENQLNAVAGHIRNIAHSNYNKKDLVTLLNGIYQYIAHSPDLNWQDLFAQCGEFRYAVR